MRYLSNKHIHLIPAALAFISTGTLLVIGIIASANFGQVRVEPIEISGTAEMLEDETASKGSFIQFDEGSQGNGGNDPGGSAGDTVTDGSSDGSASGSDGSSGDSGTDGTGGDSGGSDSGDSGTDGGTDGTATSGDSGGDSGGDDGGGDGSSGPTLVWADEFTGSSLSSTYWKVEHSTYGDGNNELQCYTPDQVSVANGKLRLEAKEQSTTCPNGDTRAVTSGMVRSQNVVFEPGMSMEWSAKLTPSNENNQGGLWPALWASGWVGGGWPTGGEWDGFEVMTAVDPFRTVYSLHWRNSSGNYQKTSTPIYSAKKFSDNTHTFRFEYGTDGTLVWYRDGFETKRVTSLDTQQGYPAPFDQDMKEIKINLALGGNPGPLDTRALPATLEIGYIRIYQD